MCASGLAVSRRDAGGETGEGRSLREEQAKCKAAALASEEAAVEEEGSVVGAGKGKAKEREAALAVSRRDAEEATVEVRSLREEQAKCKAAEIGSAAGRVRV